jgi:hypothetical protein
MDTSRIDGDNYGRVEGCYRGITGRYLVAHKYVYQ